MVGMMMEGFSVKEDEATFGRKESGKFLKVSPQHRRSKSASDRNLGVPRGGILNSIKRHNKDDVSPPSTNAFSAQSPLHGCLAHFNKNSPSHRSSLEQDIEQLQLRLQQERSMRLTLERAMGRVSSTLSPGHRHFAAQTKELIAEIELLEEEVANREQHVLTLYRNIFEHCVSRPSSQQSSSVTSPAHAKRESRKHPRIISSSFCSSKNFALRPWQALVSSYDFGKRTNRASHLPLYGGKINFECERAFSNKFKDREKIPVVEKTSAAGPRTLKDHLYQCPSRLSEEMVGCMAAVYFWLRSTASIDPDKDQPPVLSGTSTKVVLPRHGLAEDGDWLHKSTIEISWITTDKRKFSHASYAINNYRVLVEQLERVNVTRMGKSAQTAFWINLYNSLIMHAYLAYGIPQNSIRRLALFHKAAYNVGGHIVTVNAIEQSIFGFRTPRLGRWYETIISTALRKKSGEEKQLIRSKFGLQNSQPVVCFALCTGALSDPVLRVYTAANVDGELEVAKRDFLQANVTVKKSRKLFLPKMLERFAREASISTDDLLKWVTKNVDKKLRDSIQKCVDGKTNRKASQIIEWLPHSSRFRYLVSKDLIEKPWWF